MQRADAAMGTDEIIKHLPDAVNTTKELAELAETLKLSEVVKAFFGDAADELGQTLTDRVRLYRYGRSLKMLKKAEKMAIDAGFTPKAVPIKLLFPLLEGASLEENEDLHTMWAALLANAASPDKVTNVRLGFIAILKNIAPDEAALLKWFFQTSQIPTVALASEYEPGPPKRRSEVTDAYVALGFGNVSKHQRFTVTTLTQDFEFTIDSLQAARLIRQQDNLTLGLDMEKPEGNIPQPYIKDRSADPFFSMTHRGYQFVIACTPPKPKS
jgi:Abortive infection alpha